MTAIDAIYGNDKLSTLPFQQQPRARTLIYAANGIPGFCTQDYIREARRACRRDHLQMEPWNPQEQTLAEYAHSIPVAIRPALMDALYGACDFNGVPRVLVPENN